MLNLQFAISSLSHIFDFAKHILHHPTKALKRGLQSHKKRNFFAYKICATKKLARDFILSQRIIQIYWLILHLQVAICTPYTSYVSQKS